MKSSDFHFDSANGAALYGWRVEADVPAAEVFIVHGYAEHSNRHRRLAEALARSSLTAISYDQLGFGKSSGRRAFCPAFGRYVDDLGLIIDRYAKPSLPLFVFGHSMGGTVAARYAERAGSSFDGLILSSPALRLFQPAWLQKAAVAIASIAPRLKTGPFNPRTLSRDPKVIDAYVNDPLVYTGRVLARTGAEMVKGADAALADASRLDLPLLVVHGSADGLTDPEGSKTLYAEASSVDKTLKIIDGAYHETFNDPGGDAIIDLFVRWILDRV